MPAGKRWAPILGELVAILRRFGELDIDGDTATLLAGMSAAAIDRRLDTDRHRHRHRLDGEPQRAQQGPQMGVRRARRHRQSDAVPDPGRRQRHWIGVHQPSPAGTVRERQITCTRSRPGNNNDGCHVEQKNWAIVRIVVSYHRYDTEAELVVLNKIWALQSKLTNYFYPQQKLVSKVRGAPR
jgi:hypothetical protein